ncbi:reverse transcriptase domain-containing protein [Tanacetum coccineum]
MYSGEVGMSNDISGLESLVPLTFKRQPDQRAKRKYQPSDCLADPRRQPPFSCRQSYIDLLQYWRHLWDRHPNLVKLEESKDMVDSQLEEEGAQRVELEGTGTGSREGPFEPAQLAQTIPSPTFIKENIDVLRTMIKEHDQQTKAKATLKKLVCDDSGEEGSDSSETKGLAKIPRNIKVYEGSKDPGDHLGIFSAAAEQEEWPMPIWCKMFRQTLSSATRNWFDDLDPKSVDSFEELSQKFLEEFSQQKRYAKDPTKIHGIKRRLNERLQAFMDRFKSESSHIKGVPPVLLMLPLYHKKF